LIRNSPDSNEKPANKKQPNFVVMQLRPKQHIV